MEVCSKVKRGCCWQLNLPNARPVSFEQTDRENKGENVSYIYRLILVCIPLFGAFAATAEVQRIDRDQETVSVESKAELVLALNTLAPTVLAANEEPSVSSASSRIAPDEVMAGASAGLPICLALVLLVTLIRQRV